MIKNKTAQLIYQTVYITLEFFGIVIMNVHNIAERSIIHKASAVMNSVMVRKSEEK